MVNLMLRNAQEIENFQSCWNPDINFRRHALVWCQGPVDTPVFEILSPVTYLQQKHRQSQVSKNCRNPNSCKLICEPAQCMFQLYNEYLQEQKSFPSSSKETSRMSGLNWKKSMHKEGRTLRLAMIMGLHSCRRGLKQNHLDKQLQHCI